MPANRSQKKPQNRSDQFVPIEPALTFQVESPEDDPTVKNAGQPDPAGEQVRASSQKALNAAGFQFANNLPTAGHRAAVEGKLRPLREIASRLMALDALFTWVTSPESVSTERLQAYIKRNALLDHLTGEEQEILSLSRADANSKHSNTIGWRLENMWALAWILGFDPAPDVSGQLSQEISRAVVLDFLPGLDATVDDLLNKAQPRSEAEVVSLEDLFYCAHNAVRSAQTGSTSSVPEDFHPIIDGGAVHERRHALSWALSPGVNWDDADLTT